MTNVAALEAAALRTQQAAGRAWADLMTDRQNAELIANYNAAKAAQDAAYEAYKAVAA